MQSARLRERPVIADDGNMASIHSALPMMGSGEQRGEVSSTGASARLFMCVCGRGGAGGRGEAVAHLSHDGGGGLGEVEGEGHLVDA